MTIKFAPYKAGSRSVQRLCDALGCRALKVDGNSRYRHRPGDVIINWGRSEWPFPFGATLNQPEAVAVASNKLLTYQRLAEAQVSQPDWTENQDVVRRWLNEGRKVMARTVLNGHSGRGIVVMEPETVDIVPAPVYTVYVPKRSEWRIHVFNGWVIDRQRKIRDPNDMDRPANEVDWNVRNRAGGFVYVRNTDEELWHDEISRVAIDAVDELGLDFGAVDVIWNQSRRQAYVLEVNTAPGVEGTTVERYAEAIREIM
jgi:glutathione synthase/RimK-type ligase-like ATP-grasp enzyme